MEIDILSVVWWILCKCSRKNAKKIERIYRPVYECKFRPTGVNISFETV